MAPANAIGVELMKARRMLRVAEAQERAEALKEVSTDDLIGKRAQITAQRRELKAEQRAINAALAGREALDQAKEFLPKLTPAQRQTLKAELDR
jgi:small-conductance mechanosensitive channel